MEIYQNQLKSMRVNANPWKSLETCENLYKIMKINQNRWDQCKLMKTHEIAWIFRKSYENQSESVQNKDIMKKH